MLDKREEFILDVRRASRTERMSVQSIGSGLENASAIERILSRAAIWLTPKIVEAYDPDSFRDWSAAEQNELNGAVLQFKSIASTVTGDQPASESQFREGFAAFSRLKTAVATPVLAEWRSAAEELLQHLQKWSLELMWRTQRKEKKLQESLLGDYQLDQLLVFAEDELFICDPVARFAPNCLGTFDLSIQPSYDRNGIYRALDRQWMVQFPDSSHRPQAHPLDRETFQLSLESLRALQ